MQLGYISPFLTVTIFDSQIDPIMQYTSEVGFHNKEIPVLEKIHLQFLCLKKRSSMTTLNDNHQSTQSNQSGQVSILNG